MSINMLNQKGFTLLELLIALAISAVLFLMLCNTLITQYSTQRWQAAISTLQENARFASFLLQKGIAETGYIGCGRVGKLIQFHNKTSQPIDENNLIQGYEAIGDQWQPALPSRLPRSVLKGNDVIEIHQAEDEGRFLLSDMNNLRKLSIESPDQLKIRDQMIIANCQYADVFEVDEVVSRSHNRYEITPKDPLSRLYPKNTFVGKWIQVFFYIADTKRKNAQGKPIYALYTLDKNGYNTELVEGISGMKIRYGIKPAAVDSSLQYVTASIVNNQKKWEDVIAIKIDLLVDSVESLPSYTSHYQFAGKEYSVQNDSFHKNWTAVLNLQERIPLCSKVSC